MNYKVTIARGASGSPSSRRAWIEMTKPFLHKQSFYVVALLAEGVDRNSQQDTSRSLAGVALLAEGVDRNCSHHDVLEFGQMSPSSRRVWIEIIHHHLRPFFFPVALLAEGVDRNL